MYKVKDVADIIEKLATKSLAESWDNVGLMVGDSDDTVRKIFVCLDITSENVSEAIRANADMIVSHHPLIFSPLKRVVEGDITGSIVRALIQNNISAYSAHTNLDHANGGTNDALAEKLGLYDTRRFTDEECRDEAGAPLCNIGRIGTLEYPMQIEDFVSFTKSVLGCTTIKYVGTPGDMISSVAVCSGSGGDGIYSAYHAGADAYVTADIRHHEAQLAFELGLNLIDAGHFETENTVCEFMKEYLEKNLPGISVISSEAEPYLK